MKRVETMQQTGSLRIIVQTALWLSLLGGITDAASLAHFCLIWCSFAFGQQNCKTLNQAIQVVRNWLGDPNAVVQFKYSVDYSFDLCGPNNDYKFQAGIYCVTVDINTMTVTSWNIHPKVYVQNAQTNLPMLNEEQIKNR